MMISCEVTIGPSRKESPPKSNSLKNNFSPNKLKILIISKDIKDKRIAREEIWIILLLLDDI